MYIHKQQRQTDAQQSTTHSEPSRPLGKSQNVPRALRERGSPLKMRQPFGNLAILGLSQWTRPPGARRGLPCVHPTLALVIIHLYTIYGNKAITKVNVLGLCVLSLVFAVTLLGFPSLVLGGSKARAKI